MEQPSRLRAPAPTMVPAIWVPPERKGEVAKDSIALALALAI